MGKLVIVNVTVQLATLETIAKTLSCAPSPQTDSPAEIVEQLSEPLETVLVCAQLASQEQTVKLLTLALSEQMVLPVSMENLLEQSETVNAYVIQDIAVRVVRLLMLVLLIRCNVRMEGP